MTNPQLITNNLVMKEKLRGFPLFLFNKLKSIRQENKGSNMKQKDKFVSACQLCRPLGVLNSEQIMQFSGSWSP